MGNLWLTSNFICSDNFVMGRGGGLFLKLMNFSFSNFVLYIFLDIKKWGGGGRNF